MGLEEHQKGKVVKRTITPSTTALTFSYPLTSTALRSYHLQPQTWKAVGRKLARDVAAENQKLALIKTTQAWAVTALWQLRSRRIATKQQASTTQQPC